MSRKHRIHHGRAAAAFAAVAISLCFAVSCGTSTRKISFAGGPDGSAGCVLNSDCKDPAQPVCIFKTCSIACRTDGDCSNGLLCVPGPDGPACASDSQSACGTGSSCTKGTTCIQNKCQVTCSTSSLCPTHETCSNDGVCVTAPSSDAGPGTGGAPGSGGASSGGAGGAASGGTSGSGGTATGGTTGAGGGASGGTSADSGAPTCSPACTDPNPVCVSGTCVACIDGNLRCNNSGAPEKCVSGSWTANGTCSGSTPACSNGVCSAAKGTGTIITVANGVLTTSTGPTIRLVDHGFEFAQKTCGTVQGNQVCVTGAIRP